MSISLFLQSQFYILRYVYLLRSLSPFVTTSLTISPLPLIPYPLLTHLVHYKIILNPLQPIFSYDNSIVHLQFPAKIKPLHNFVATHNLLKYLNTT